MNSKNQLKIPTGISVALAVVTAILFQTGNAKLAWIVLVAGVILGLVLGMESIRKAEEREKSIAEENNPKTFNIKFTKDEFDFVGPGTITISDSHVRIEGSRQWPVFAQAGVILAITVALFFLFKFQLGVIPAVVVVTLLCRYQSSLHWNSDDLELVTRENNIISFWAPSHNSRTPHKAQFSVIDGVTLATELQGLLSKQSRTTASPLVAKVFYNAALRSWIISCAVICFFLLLISVYSLGAFTSYLYNLLDIPIKNITNTSIRESVRILFGILSMIFIFLPPALGTYFWAKINRPKK